MHHLIKYSAILLLYHGSFTQVPEIDLFKGKQGKNFGRGFYVTFSYKQAQNFRLQISLKFGNIHSPV